MFNILTKKKFNILENKWNSGVDKTGIFLVDDEWKKNQNNKLFDNILKKIKKNNFNLLNKLFVDFNISKDNIYFFDKQDLIENLKNYNKDIPDTYEKHKFYLDLDAILQYIYTNQLNEDLKNI